MAVASKTRDLPDIPGLCGIVDGSVLPGYLGLEAGQSAVGGIFSTGLLSIVCPPNIMKKRKSGGLDLHQLLTEKAEKLKPGESGLLALDWNNGNRTILVDVRLTGLMMGQTLQTRPEEVPPGIDRRHCLRCPGDHRAVRGIRRSY